MLKINNTIVGAVMGSAVVIGAGVAVYKNREVVKEKLHEFALGRSAKKMEKLILHLEAVRLGKKKENKADIATANAVAGLDAMNTVLETSGDMDTAITIAVIETALEEAEKKGVDIDALKEFSKEKIVSFMNDTMEEVIKDAGDDFDLSEKENMEMHEAFAEGFHAAFGKETANV